MPTETVLELASPGRARRFGCPWTGEADKKGPPVMLVANAAVTRGARCPTVFHVLDIARLRSLCRQLAATGHCRGDFS